MSKAPDFTTRVRSLSELTALYGTPSQRSLDKEIDYVSDHYQAFIEMLQSLSPESIDGESYDKGYPDYMNKKLY